jgi:hypothetical protein
VVPLQKHIKHGDFLWELLYPKDKDGLPGRSASGRYKVKLFVLVSLWHVALQQQWQRQQRSSSGKQANMGCMLVEAVQWLFGSVFEAACIAAVQ